MARRQPPTYDAMTLKAESTQAVQEIIPIQTTQTSTDRGNQGLKDISAQLMLYIHPDAAKSLQRYALEQSTLGQKVKVHDLLIEAVEDWFRRHGLRETVRAKEPKKNKRLLSR